MMMTIVYNARLFCTRWQGLLADKEFEGNLIHLLENGVAKSSKTKTLTTYNAIYEGWK